MISTSCDIAALCVRLSDAVLDFTCDAGELCMRSVEFKDVDNDDDDNDDDDDDDDDNFGLSRIAVFDLSMSRLSLIFSLLTISRTIDAAFVGVRLSSDEFHINTYSR